MKQRSIGYAFLFSALLLGTAFAATGGNTTSRLEQALSDLCKDVNGLIPIAAMLMILLAAVIYATGQMMGAETRARANVWATSCLTGALIGILIATIAPAVLGIIAGNAIAC